MALYRINDWYPDYKDRFFDGDSMKSIAAYASGSGEEEKIGNVHNFLVDEAGRIRYLVVDTGFWIFGKKIMLPISRCVDDPEYSRIFVTDLTKEQAESLPEYSDTLMIDYDCNDRVCFYRVPQTQNTPRPKLRVL